MVNINTTMLWQLFNFFVLLFLLRKFLYSPVKEILDKRAAQINGDLDDAEARRKEAEEIKAEYEQKLKNAHTEAQEIVDKAETRANKKAKNIINEAEEKAENLKAKKLEEIEQAKKEAAAELRDSIANYTVLAANKLIREQLDENKHQQMIMDFIDDLDKEELGELR
ncbi:ATP synthase F0 subcomplex B subunit [Halanaerobium congolense]|uniref:ATP synthase subunit b n=1 Tax=Halanaerobium congolense TaxID=54121 RepID=A0A1G6J257_9FIRM|nr:F0F1 ATP synthase subunit B [Halanaerobium congolense]KXS48675.1 MAG: ATP synthase subunit b [Halanaerobium sp. T82-1]PTX15816.1 ATP synthase F0 subcomplex B subunit [Halanaerobium congolense]TDP24174.1 ATP synthase F0 subcomplex B subunit [Halanaerobium congolense]TDX45221.1 ATP synthase F0 subcomplex B subunit [Halanaerobium congolense]SDC12924.1 ATP synthase F0 subcomplex B subunit [Halanaerobium congolense]